MAKSPPIDSETLAAVIAALGSAWAEGCPVAPDDPCRQEETARVVIRRWRSSARRGINQSDHPSRVRDLAKGLIEAFEPDAKLTGPLIRDYDYLAAQTAKAL